MLRSERRHRRFRKVARAYRVYLATYGPYYCWDCKTKEEVHACARSWASKTADNMKTCSEACCGNRRKLEGPTLAERRFELAMKEELS